MAGQGVAYARNGIDDPLSVLASTYDEPIPNANVEAADGTGCVVMAFPVNGIAPNPRTHSQQFSDSDYLKPPWT